jgi:hypothetical protein
MDFMKFVKSSSFLLLVLILVIFLQKSSLSKELPENKLPQNAAEALVNTVHLTLYSLSGMIEYSLNPASSQDDSDKKLYGWRILGKVELDNAEAKKAAGAFQDAVAGWDGLRARCFEPRHAIRLNSNGHTYDYLLCYTCSQMAVYEDGKPISGVGAMGSPDVLNSLLTDAHVPLADIYNQKK